MDENKQNTITSLFDQLAARLQVEIKRANIQELEHVAHIVLQLEDFKNATNNKMAMESKNEQIFGEVVKMMKRSNQGPLSGGPMPGTIFGPTSPTEP